MATVPKAVIASKAAPMVICVTGRIDTGAFQMARVLARSIAEEHTHVTVEAAPLVQAEWEAWLRGTLPTLGAGVRHSVSPLVTVNGAYVGSEKDLLSWARTALKFEGSLGNPIVYNQMAKQEYRKWLATNPHPMAYMDVVIGDGAPQRVVYELFNERCPKAAENFLALCTGDRGTATSGTKLHYAGSPFHRVVKGGWVQGGDIEGGHGDGGQSVFGPTFPDESFEVKQDRAGVLVMASADAPHTNGSQFYVTLAPMPWMDRKRVAFGRVISGMRVFRMIEKLETVNQRPVTPVVVKACGEYPVTRKSRSGAGAGAGAGAAAKK